MTDTAQAPAPAKPTRKRHADGIYLGLPMEAYVEDDALSGSGVATLLSEPGAFQWERVDNPLYDAPESKPQLRGSGAHCAILEGLEAYEAAYCLPPKGAHVLRTGDELSGWLKRSKEAGLHTLATSGKVDELRARVAMARKDMAEDHPLYPRFAEELIGGRKLIGEADDMFIRLLESFVRAPDNDLAHLVSDGVPEVSIFITRSDGVRVKCRADYLNRPAITDLKTYGRAPGRSRTLKKHLVREAFYNAYDLQAVHNHQTVMAAGRMCLTDELAISGGDDATANRLIEIFGAHQDKPPVFHWLFLRMGGAISGIAIPYRQSDGRWQYSRDEIAEAIETLKSYRKRCGEDQLWLTSEGVQEIEDTDWPLDAWEGRV